MYCRNCGKQLPEGARFCDGCGAQQNVGNTAYTGYAMNTQTREPKPSVGFFDAVKLFFTRYADFSTRSRRSEYWWVILFCSIAGSIAGAVLKDYSWIWSLAILIPSIAVSVRRLHDIGKTGTWYLLNLIPLVGQIILIIWFCGDSTEDNQWGPNPKYCA